MIKSGIKIQKRRKINYVKSEDGRWKKYKQWDGDYFSFLYDFLMEKIIYPKKLNADLTKHYDILRKELEGIYNKNVLELSAGSGNAVNFLSRDNMYRGTDISVGLLRQAVKKFNKAAFKNAEFYVTGAEDFPFEDDTFEVCLSVLSINFYPDLTRTAKEIFRVLKNDSVFLACVPTPERNSKNSKISGTLYTEEDLKAIFEESGFRFSPITQENGALFYFKAKKITI